MAPAVPPPPPPPDPAQVARDALEAARAKRLRIAQAEQQAEPDTAAIAVEAQSCAADARRAWAALFPEAAAKRDRERVGVDGAEPLYLELGRVVQLAPDLDGAGAERELGALRAALPAYAGGDLDQAREHLLAALRRAPQDARNHLVLARTVAVKAQDRALFRDHLEAVLGLGDALAAAQADALLQREDELFGPKGEAAQPIPGGPQR